MGEFGINSSGIGSDSNPSVVDIRNVDVTPFNEIVTTSRTSQMNYKPTWGISVFRYNTSATTGVGASVAETNGEFLLSSGTAISNVAAIETNARGQYDAGSLGQAGIGVRYPTSPTGTQSVRWGYSDFIDSGFYFGENATGKFVAYLTGGTETLIYQNGEDGGEAWNGDKLDGNGASGLTLDYSKGIISHINFTWYAYGTIEYVLFVYNPATKKLQKVVVNTVKIQNKASIVDPNQPLKFEVRNGASSSTNLELYIGGHQFSVFNSGFVSKTRELSEYISDYTLLGGTAWQPIIAIRKKLLFNGRPNSVNVDLRSIAASADGELITKITYGGTTSNLSWSTPTDIPVTETSVESKITTSGTPLTASSEGIPIEDYGFIDGLGNRAVGSYGGNKRFELSPTSEMMFWVKRLDGTGTIKLKLANLGWSEGF